ncbi:MAG: hypothetical protein M3Q69_08360 [Acidobacteriota bacterium]|nr:hypothetical protein [Acidobacteriota bacterium]
MRQVQVVAVLCLFVVSLVAQQPYPPSLQPQIPCSPPPTGIDPAMPMNQPDRFAWELFIQVNQKAAPQYQHTITIDTTSGGQTLGQTSFVTNNAVWETWADDPLTFPKHPDPANPPKWPDAPFAKRLHPKGKGGHHTHTAAVAGQIILDTGGEEIHRNRPTFDYIVRNGLWYQQGIAAFVAKKAPANFPADSIEVKGNWIRIQEAQKSQFHWNYDLQGRLWGLAAMHISSKALPNWFWSTFEWVGNAGRCDYIGCQDCFGYTPSYVPSNTCPPNASCTSMVGKVYTEPSTMTAGLQSLLKQAGYTGEWLTQFGNYRLKGSMTNFTTPTGQPILLGNSVTESSFLQTASCMTCHSRAAVNADGSSAFPFFGEAPSLPLQAGTPSQFQTQQTTFNGSPDPNWFSRYTENFDDTTNVFTGMVTPLATQMDFVWAIPFQAQRAGAPTIQPNTPPKK